jgi:hypothetical protein
VFDLGWAHSASGDRTERLDSGCAIFPRPKKLKLCIGADRTRESPEAIEQTEVPAERFENRYWCAELHRLRGVFLAAIGADETQIEASFQEAVRTGEERKSVSLQKRAEASYAEYRRQKASGSGERAFRLPLW